MKLTHVRCCVYCYENFCILCYIATLDELPKTFVPLDFWKGVGFGFHTPSTSTSMTLCFFPFVHVYLLGVRGILWDLLSYDVQSFCSLIKFCGWQFSLFSWLHATERILTALLLFWKKGRRSFGILIAIYHFLGSASHMVTYDTSTRHLFHSYLALAFLGFDYSFLASFLSQLLGACLFCPSFDSWGYDFLLFVG